MVNQAGIRIKHDLYETIKVLKENGMKHTLKNKGIIKFKISKIN